MNEITYESIAPIVARSSVEGRTLSASFRCPVSGDTFGASAPIPRGRAPRVEGGLTGLRGAMARFLSGVFGAGAAAQDEPSGDSGGQVSESERREGLVAAFGKVAHRFVWDGSQGHWLSARAAVGVVPEFTRQLSEYPVTAHYDRTMLARMLVEIAAADGTLADEEQAFLAAFIPTDVGTLDELLQRPRLTALELREASEGATRETLLMVAWAMALTDEELAAEEEARLSDLADGLGLAESLATELRHYAQVFVVDQALERVWASGRFDPAVYEEIQALAARMELDEAAFASIDHRFRRRNGL